MMINHLCSPFSCFPLILIFRTNNMVEAGLMQTWVWDIRAEENINISCWELRITVNINIITICNLRSGSSVIVKCLIKWWNSTPKWLRARGVERTKCNWKQTLNIWNKRKNRDLLLTSKFIMPTCEKKCFIISLQSLNMFCFRSMWGGVTMSTLLLQPPRHHVRVLLLRGILSS